MGINEKSNAVRLCAFVAFLESLAEPDVVYMLLCRPPHAPAINVYHDLWALHTSRNVACGGLIGRGTLEANDGRRQFAKESTTSVILPRTFRSSCRAYFVKKEKLVGNFVPNSLEYEWTDKCRARLVKGKTQRVNVVLNLRTST